MSRALNPFAASWVPKMASQNSVTRGNDAAVELTAPAPPSLAVFDVLALPAEVITTILSNLQNPADVVHCILTGKELCHLVAGTDLCLDLGAKAASGRGSGDSIDAKEYKRGVLQSLRKYMPGTVALYLPNLSLDDDEVAQLVGCLPRLQLLDVSGCRKLTPAVTGTLVGVGDGAAATTAVTHEPAQPQPPQQTRATLRILNLQRCFQLHHSALSDVLSAAAAAPAARVGAGTPRGLQAVCLSHIDMGRWPLPATAAGPVAGQAWTGPGCGSSSSSLTVLALHNCMRLTDSAMSALADACGSSVRFLLLGGSTLASYSAGASNTHAACAALPEHVRLAVSDLVAAALPKGRGGGAALNVSSVTVAGHVAAAQSIVAMALRMPLLEALELTFFPQPVLQVWDLATRAGGAAAASAASRMRAALCGDGGRSRLASYGGGSTAGAVGRGPELVAQCGAATALRCAVNCSGPTRSTPLHFAAERGDAPYVSALLALGAGADARENGGATPLFLACEAGHAEAVLLLLAAGADPHLKNASGESPLYIAALRGHLAVVTALLEHFQARGIAWQDPSLYGDSWTPLHAAAVANRTDVAATLLSAAGAAGAGSLVGAVNKYGQSVVHIAARKGSAALLRLLLAWGGNAVVGRPDTSGDTPVDVAKKNRHVLALAEFRKACASA